MRDIKFRGKSIPGDSIKQHWVYGQGILIGGHGTRIHYSDYVEVNVIRETVGQYTGLKDVQSKEIFEGDIMEELATGIKYEVAWSDEYLAWVLRNSQEEKALVEILNRPEQCQIIGNIVDSPELLKRC